MADAPLKAKTGRTWEQWVRTLDEHDAAQMAHPDIARLVSDTYGVQAWWTQTVTVGYERIKGLRVRGQRRDGTYEASKSRTFSVPVTELFDAWAEAPLRKRWLAAAGAKVRSATAPKAMRILWPDGSVVIAGFTAKGPRRARWRLRTRSCRTVKRRTCSRGTGPSGSTRWLTFLPGTSSSRQR
jgi:hypothetical protein